MNCLCINGGHELQAPRSSSFPYPRRSEERQLQTKTATRAGSASIWLNRRPPMAASSSSRSFELAASRRSAAKLRSAGRSRHGKRTAAGQGRRGDGPQRAARARAAAASWPDHV
jgi:hypothetical protein